MGSKSTSILKTWCKPIYNRNLRKRLHVVTLHAHKSHDVSVQRRLAIDLRRKNGSAPAIVPVGLCVAEKRLASRELHTCTCEAGIRIGVGIGIRIGVGMGVNMLVCEP